jgi:hypothetical protein
VTFSKSMRQKGAERKQGKLYESISPPLYVKQRE